MSEQLEKLKEQLMEIDNLRSAAALLYWDQATYMPPGGATARGQQIATLNRISHEKFTSDRMGELLEDLAWYELESPYDSDEASLVRITRLKYEKAIKVPSDFMAKISNHSAASYQAWTKARPANDFSTMLPYLEKTLELSRQLADFYPGYEHIANPLIDRSDEGMKAEQIRLIFSELRSKLVPMVNAITNQIATDVSCLHGDFPEQDQFQFGNMVIKQLGFDFNRGRQDKTHHPFMTKFSINDVRITTRSKDDDISESLFSTIHEAGHAFYELGINENFNATPLGSGTSSGIHESQSRLWENIVGRSREFWEFFYPKLQSAFPGQFDSVPIDQFYKAINNVERSLIRTDADEVTYNLHVMMRFDLELDLLVGQLAIKDLPQAWNERFRSDFGIVPTDDSNGVLQDVHWYSGTIGGAFQGYTLGNILSRQFYDRATQTHSEISTEIANGKFDTLQNWLREQIYRHGSKFTPNELIRRVTGNELSIEPYIRYLWGSMVNFISYRFCLLWTDGEDFQVLMLDKFSLCLPISG
ncbi:MAG: carboxypeptidase M32 [Candidatus Poribacteria bacterium]